MTASKAGGEGGRLLWLLRHAKAAPDPPPGGTDHDRPLAPRGRRDAAALGQRLGAGDLGFAGTDLPAVVLCSTAIRTTETAERVTSRIPVTIDRRRRLYYGSPADVLAELWTMDDLVRSVLVVGHNPTTHTLALDLLAPEDTGGRATLEARGFPTCALAVYRVGAARWRDVVAGTGTLVGYFTPPY